MTHIKMPVRKDKTKGKETMMDQLKKDGFDPRKSTEC